MAAQSFRAWLWDAEGWTVWNAQWYGGHHVPGYSMLFPPLAGLLGPYVAVAVCGVAAAGALVSLAPTQATAWLLAAAAVANLAIGRGPFILGVAFGALALLAWTRRRPGWAGAASLATVAASPVAGIFLCLIGAVHCRSIALVAPAAAGGLALGLLFPEGGAERFVATAFWPMLALCAAAVWLLPGRLRWAAGAYVLVLVAAFALDTPMGHNATRLAALAGPALLVACGRGPRWAVFGVAAALLYLQWLPAVRAVHESRGDPATHAAFHAPLLDFLARAAAPGDRLEIPLTRNHWETAHVARGWPLARGWERQLDRKVNGLFYSERSLTAGTYEAWLRREGIRWVALPDAPLDFSARAEARLVAGEPAFLRPAFRTAGWRVYELREPHRAPEIVRSGPSELLLRLAGPGRVVLRRRWTRYWRVADGRAEVSRAGDFIAIDAPGPGTVRLVASL